MHGPITQGISQKICWLRLLSQSNTPATIVSTRQTCFDDDEEMANQALLAQLAQLASQLNALEQTVRNLQASNNTLTTRIATLEAENTTLTAANTTLTAQAKSRSLEEALRLAALPEVVQELPPQSPLRQLLQWLITKIWSTTQGKWEKWFTMKDVRKSPQSLTWSQVSEERYQRAPHCDLTSLLITPL